MWPTKLVRMLIVNWFDDTSINDWLEIVETCTKGCSPSEKKQENVGILLNVLTRNKGGDALASKNSEKWCCSIITHKRQLIQHSNDRKNHQCPPHQWTVAPPAHTPPTDNMTQQNLPEPLRILDVEQANILIRQHPFDQLSLIRNLDCERGRC